MAKYFKVKGVEIGQGRPKICAIVLGETREEILDLAVQSNTGCCDLIEFRADHYKGVLDLEDILDVTRQLRKAARKPIIFTFRRYEEGGKTKTTLKYYKELLNAVAAEELAEIIDVEASSVENDEKLIPKLKGLGAYVIVSKHDFVRTPSQEEIVKEYFRLEALGGDILKVAYMPNNKKDVINLLVAVEEFTSSYASKPVVAISMGHLGMITRIMGEFLESAITFAAITKASAPGQINVEGIGNILDLIHDNYKKVFLIGFMGTGKTSVANALASTYGLKKVDLDAYIEMREGMTVADIFDSQSESYFRDKETKYLRQVIKKNYQVISLGGGIVLRQENLEMMKSKGVIVLLTAKPETIQSRVSGDGSRPVLGNNFDLDYIVELMKQREEKYLQTADVVISTDDKDVDSICKEIVETLGFNL